MRRLSRPSSCLAAALWLASIQAAAQELPPNDFQISSMVTPPAHASGNHGIFPDVAYNSVDDEYLVVWQGEIGLAAPFEVEIFGRRLDAETGSAIGSQFRISRMGPDGSSAYGAFQPAVAYNLVDNEYLVVWFGDHDVAMVDEEFEIFGQRIDGSTGDLIGGATRITNHGPANSASGRAELPAVAYDHDSEHYLVVWGGNVGTGDYEVFGSLLESDLSAVVPSFQISERPPGSVPIAFPDYPYPAVTKAQNGEFAAVWADHDKGGAARYEYEIFGRLIEAETGSLIGSSDTRVSYTEPLGDTDHDAMLPSIEICEGGSRPALMVVWRADPSVNEEYDIHGQLLNLNFSPYGEAFSVSETGSAISADIVGRGGWDDFVVVWWGGGDELAAGEYEIFMERRGTANGERLGDSDIRITDIGPASDPAYDARYPAVAERRSPKDVLVVFDGVERKYDVSGGFFYDDQEIFGQRLGGWIFSSGFEYQDLRDWLTTGVGSVSCTPGAAQDGSYGLHITLEATCGSSHDTVLTNRYVSGPLYVESCHSILAGDGLWVYADGDVTLSAGHSIVLQDGFSVGHTPSAMRARLGVSATPTAFVQDDSAKSEESYRATFYTNFNYVHIPTGDELEHFVGYDPQGQAIFKVVIQPGPVVALRARHTNGTFYSTTSVSVGAYVFDRVELSWESGPSATVSLVVNGTPRELIGLDTSGLSLEFVRWGVVGGTIPGSFGTIYQDSFDSLR